jgi:competence protein ComEC
MYLNRPELLQGRNTILVIMIVLSSVFLFRVMMLHQEYLHFTQFDSKVVDAEVLRHYQKTKNSKTYDVLKLRIDGSIFYTTSYKKYEPLHYKTIMIKLFIKELSFYEYLHTFYLPSHIIKIYHDRSQKENLINVIEKQHESKIIEEIYKALFLAIPVSKEVRNSISALGVAHLLAISGFHLGLLSAIIFFILKPILRYYYKGTSKNYTNQ